MMFVLTAAVGLSVVIALVGFSIETSPPHTFGKPLMFVAWAVASFCGGSGLAILYNGTWRNVLYVGVIALIGNEAISPSGQATVAKASLPVAFTPIPVAGRSPDTIAFDHLCGASPKTR